MVRQATPTRPLGNAGDHQDLGVQAWSRRSLIAMLSGVTAAAVAVVVGLVLVVVSALGTSDGATSPGAISDGTVSDGTISAGAISDGVAGAPAAGSPSDRSSSGLSSGSLPGSESTADGDRRAVRDAAASRPMASVDDAAARGGLPAPVAGPTIEIGAATRTGPADVPTGFEQTPAGAVGQLGAIVITVLEAMSIQRVGEVHAAWVMPGGPGVEQWRMTGNVQAFLGRAGQAAGSGGGTGSRGFDVRVVPAAAQVKAVDGPDWVLACVLVEVTAVITATARLGYGHCERMQWDSGSRRWMIGPGAQPARAPSTWPGTELSYTAGWRTWLTAPAPSPAPSPAPTPAPSSIASPARTPATGD